MLLFFRGTSATLTASIIGIGSVVATGSTVTASIIGTGIVIPPESIEFQITANCIGTGTVLAISQGFLSRSAFADGSGFVNAFGGFGGTASLIGTGLVSATVGSFFDGGNVSITGVGSVTVAGQFTSTSSIIGTGLLSAVPIISGGTISSASSIVGIGSVLVSVPLFTETASMVGQGFVHATGGLEIPTLATQVRLTFSTDDIRTFFRTG